MVCADGDDRLRLGQGAVHRAAQLARGHDDQARRGRATTTRATGWSRSPPATTAPTRSAPGSSYPVDYDFGYTWFHEAEWEAGNRRSVCWAKTEAMTRLLRPLVPSCCVAARRVQRRHDEPDDPVAAHGPSSDLDRRPRPPRRRAPQPPPGNRTCYDLDYDQAVAPTDDADAGPLRRAPTPR